MLSLIENHVVDDDYICNLKHQPKGVNASPTGGSSSSSIVVRRRLFCGRIGVGGLSSGILGPVSSGVRNIFQSSLKPSTTWRLTQIGHSNNEHILINGLFTQFFPCQKQRAETQTTWYIERGSLEKCCSLSTNYQALLIVCYGSPARANPWIGPVNYQI